MVCVLTHINSCVCTIGRLYCFSLLYSTRQRLHSYIVRLSVLKLQAIWGTSFVWPNDLDL